jgi:hypothetical protein
MSSVDYTSIVGYVLFVVSELLPLLPIHTNGVFHSFLIGLQKSFKQPDKDIELAQRLINKNPSVTNLINTVSTNPSIQNCVQNILDNVNVVPYVQMLCNSPELQTIFHAASTNPMLLNNIKNLILVTHQNNLAQNQSLTPASTPVPTQPSNSSIIRNSIMGVGGGGSSVSVNGVGLGLGNGDGGVGLASIVTSNNVGGN